ncbi:alpha/beta hydrolase [Nibrella viscosa]|uniref:Alpha/beta hydrolase n=1 Tax=Nibrella viscosa TaxID=1084524 RepID=A0ABP8KKW9_9BACT
MKAIYLSCLCVALWLPGARLQAQQMATSTPASLKTAPDKYLAFDDVRLRYRDFGKGEPIVLLHGYSDNLEMTWSEVADSLAKTNRVIALDQRGFGKSSKFSDPAHYQTGLFTDVIRLLDSLGIQRAHIIGHSMGALVAANVALRYPKRMATVTLVSGAMYPDSASLPKAIGNNMTIDLRQGRGISGIVAFFYPTLTDTAMIQAINKDVMLRNDLGSLIAVSQVTPSWLISQKQATKAPMPALLMAGTNDPLLPTSRQVAGHWPGARFVEVANAGHDDVLQKPEFLREVRAWLKAGSRRSR